MSKKNITIISILIVFIVIVAGGYFFYKNSGQNNIKTDHDKYLALINDNHDFDGGLKGLETLDNDKGQEVFKNIKTEIKIAKELKNAHAKLDNKDIDSAKKALEKVDALTTDNSFDKAIDWLKEDIINYEKASKEISEAKSDEVSSILEKYKFHHSALKDKLRDEGHSSNVSSISDNENIPRVNGQQAPITYGELKRGMYNDGSSETVIGKLLEPELGGNIANFTNEQIRDAIARFNQKNPYTNPVYSGNPLDTYYSKWSAEIKKGSPNAVISKEGDKYYVSIPGENRMAIIYENPHLIRMVNATRNIHVEF